MVGDGQKEYNVADDGASTESGGCFVSRNVAPVHSVVLMNATFPHHPIGEYPQLRYFY